MFYRLSAYAIAAALFQVASASAHDVFPNGVWSDAERKLVVRISPCAAASDTFCGAIVEDNRLGPPANPPGHQLLRDMKQTRTGWTGKFNDGATSLNLTMRPQFGGTAQVRFCLGELCDNETWQRVSSVSPPNTVLRR